MSAANLPRRRLAGVAVAATTLAVAAASVAVATEALAPDGGPRGSGPDLRALSSISCGKPLSSVVKADNDRTETSNLTAARIPGAFTTVTVPAGATRCIKVRFFGEAACYGAAINFCFVRAIRSGVEMIPAGGGFQVFSSNSSTASSHAAEWIARVGAGTHQIGVQQRVDDTETTFDLDDWVMDVEVTE